MFDLDSALVILGVAGVVLILLWLLFGRVKPPPLSQPIDLGRTTAVRSWAANQLKKEYLALPESVRPGINIDAIINALDTKYTVETVNQHFRTTRGQLQTGGLWSWAHNCQHDECPLHDYVDLHLMMAALQEAHKKHEHALAIAEQQYGFEEMKKLQAQLVDETLNLVHNTASIEEGDTSV